MTPAHSYFKELHDRTTTLLHKTISIQPSLAGLITSLILGFRMSLKYTVEAVEAFITYSSLCVAILACCPNVERFMVFGLARASKCLLLQTIKTRPQLRILHMTLRDGWERDTGPLIAEYDFTDFQDILASCRQLQLLSFFDVPFTPSAPAACTVGGHLKRLNLEKVAMSDAQIVGLMATLAESLETLHISHDITNWEYKRAEYSYSALKEALALLKKLKYLHLNIEQNYPLNDLDETLLLPLTELRTVYITPLLLPFQRPGSPCVAASRALSHLGSLGCGRPAQCCAGHPTCRRSHASRPAILPEGAVDSSPDSQRGGPRHTDGDGPAP